MKILGGAIYPLPGWPGPEPWPRRSMTHHGRTKEIGHGLPSLQIRHGLPKPRIRMASRSPGSAMASRSPGSAMDAFPLSMSSSDIQGAHPPSQVLLLRRGTRRPGGGGTVREWPVSSITDRLHLHLFNHQAHLLLITAHHPCST